MSKTGKTLAIGAIGGVVFFVFVLPILLHLLVLGLVPLAIAFGIWVFIKVFK